MRWGWWDPSKSNRNLVHAKIWKQPTIPFSMTLPQFICRWKIKTVVNFHKSDATQTFLGCCLLATLISKYKLASGLHWVPHHHHIFNVGSTIQDYCLAHLCCSSSGIRIGECTQDPHPILPVPCPLLNYRLISYLQLISVYKRRFLSCELMELTKFLAKLQWHDVLLAQHCQIKRGELHIHLPEEQS